MNFFDKIKQAVIILILIAIAMYFLIALNQSDFNIVEWSKTGKFYFNGVMIISMMGTACYFIDK